MLPFAVISSTSFIKLIAGAFPNVLLQEKQTNKQPPLSLHLHEAAGEKERLVFRKQGR